MATREGIYVGGHEIVQRYVGNRLVWQKNKWSTIYQNVFSGTPTSMGDLILKFTIRYQRGFSNYSGHQGTFGSGYISIDGLTATFSSIRLDRAENSSSGDDFQYITVTFVNTADKYKFLRQFDNKVLTISVRYR